MIAELDAVFQLSCGFLQIKQLLSASFKGMTEQTLAGAC